MKIMDSMFGVKCPRCKENRIGDNQRYCDECEMEVAAEEKEGIRMCLSCGSPMSKKEYRGVIIDKCLKDGAVWLDGNELQKIKESIASDSSGDFATGMVVGGVLF